MMTISTLVGNLNSGLSYLITAVSAKIWWGRHVPKSLYFPAALRIWLVRRCLTLSKYEKPSVVIQSYQNYFTKYYEPRPFSTKKKSVHIRSWVPYALFSKKKKSVQLSGNNLN